MKTGTGGSTRDRIIKRTVDALQPGGMLWDIQMPGFGCRCLPSGRKVYVLKYRLGDGGRKARQRWMTIGTHGAPETPDSARDKALIALAGVKGGADPVGERIAGQRAETVAELCDLYMEAARAGLVLNRQKRPKKKSTLDTDCGRIERHIKPLLGKLRVSDVARHDVETFLDDIQHGKTAASVKTKPRGRAIVEGGRGTATRTVGLLGGIFTFAVRRRLRSDNPVHGVSRPADERRTRFLTPEEYAALGKALAAEEASHPIETAAIRFLALTGARRGEAIQLRWTEIDGRARCLRLGDTKTGASTRPLAQAAGDLVMAIDRQAGSPFVFNGAKAGAPIIGLPKVIAKVCQAAGFHDVTAHTLRHSFATVANELGLAEATIAALLGHRLHSITGRYTHVQDTALLAAADRVAERIADHLAGRSVAAEVIPFRLSRG